MNPTDPIYVCLEITGLARRQQTAARLSACALAGLLTLAILPSRLWSQPPSGSNYPTAIISSGGVAVVSASEPDSSDNLSVASPSPWTADRNPTASGGGLRPQANASGEQLSLGHSPSNQSPTNQAVELHASDDVRSGYPSLPTLSKAVVTASAASPAVNASGAAGQVPSSMVSTSSGVQHIPLAPPSERLTGEKPKASAGTVQMLVSIVSSLLLVVGLFLGVAWCYRKTLGTSLAGGLPKQVVSVLGRTSISARQQMVLVRFGSKLLLVSVIQGEARTLGEITDPLEVDQMLGMCESGQPGSISQSFKSLMLAEEK